MPSVSRLLGVEGPLSPDKESIFSVMTREAQAHKAINLGQGFPDFPPPEALMHALSAAAAENGPSQQYAPARGRLGLRQRLAQVQSSHYKLTYDPDTQVLVTNGGTEALFCAILSLCSAGDEVVVFEPLYDSYAAAIHLVGAKAVPVRLRAPEFRWDSAELKAAFTPKTRLVLFNSPHNPTGRVFSRAEMDELAGLVARLLDGERRSL